MHKTASLTRFALCVAIVVVGGLLTACPENMVAGAEAQKPSDALSATVRAAGEGDVERFKQGLSLDFVATIERYQELGKQRDELKGAFDWPIFMRSLAMSAPTPKEELIKGNKAIVKATHADGREVQTDLVLEDGRWKLAVPPGMVKNLDHFDEMEKLVKGEPVEPKADLQVGGGGSADRAKTLPTDATDAMKAKATALDTFDLGDLAGAEKLVRDALEQNAGDEELTVALGRIYVQTGKADDARTLYEGYLQNTPNAVPVMHYLGMAYMMANRPLDAATQWKNVIEANPEYAGRFKLQQRVMAAESIAKGGGAMGNHGSGVMPAPAAGAANPH